MGTKNSTPKKIAIQGGYGAFHEIAATKYFDDMNIDIVPRDTFQDLFNSLTTNKVDYGIMAIENSLAGSILPNYSLLLESKMIIIGEIYLRIKQNLVAYKGQKLEDIKEVFSHPMAILQCHRFFDNLSNIKLIDSLDTALSAKKIADNELKGIGAIASTLAAKKYGLDIIAEGIETNKNNYTRFLILKNANGGGSFNDTKVNKTSISFALAHKSGCLAKILSILSYYEINLSKIQSMPIVEREWEYQFYVDIEYDDYDLYKQSINAIDHFTTNLHILGEYYKGSSYME